MAAMHPSGRTASLISAGMLISGLPCSLFFFAFLEMDHAREMGDPNQGDALGLALMTVASYAIALVGSVTGLTYFAARIRRGRKLQAWQWIVIGYSFAQILSPMLYFASQ
jgi:hypothetical protein